MTADRIREFVRPYYLRWVYYRLFPHRVPSYFASCWQYPFEKLTPALRLNGVAPEKPDMLFLPMTDWHTRIQRTQHLARALARLGHRCVFVNPHLGRQFRTTPRFDPAPRLSRLEENVFELHVRLSREPIFHHGLLRAEEETAICAAVERSLEALGSRRAVQIVSFPLWFAVADRLRRKAGHPLVYDCHDYLAGFANVSRDIVDAERAAIEGADLVLFSSQELLERHGQSRAQTMIVRNAVDCGHFQTVEAVRTARPVAGYVGALDWWFDVESVERAAKENPGCDFVLAGRLEHPAIGSLAKLPNVQLLGEVPYGQLPGLFSRFRVGLIPFSVNDLTLAVNPIKLYEYFSRGIPVVSSPLPEVAAMGDLVYSATTSEQFAAQVSRAVAESDSLLQARRKEIAARESWMARASAISEAVETLL